MTLVDAQSQSHRFSGTGQVSPALRYPQIVNSLLDMEIKIKQELKSFSKFSCRNFFQIYKDLI